MAFEVTPAAARELLAAAERSGAAGMALRIAAMPTAQGLAYAMGFDEPAPEDAVQVVEGLTVLVAAGSQSWLAGTVLDYVQLDSGEHDFIFAQPPARGCASRGCGGGACGSCA